MNLSTQKRLAAAIMKVGVRKIRVKEENSEEVSRAITRDDVRHFIATGAIYALPEKGNSTGRLKARKEQKAKGRGRGPGKRTGKKTARTPKKERWMNKVRALRDELRKLKAENKIEETAYRRAYVQIKGNLYNSRRHLRESLGVQ